MNDLEQRVKEKPTVSSRLRRTEATIEDIAAADERDESRLSREYTRQDAETIIKLARDVGPTGLCVDPEEEPGSREGPIAPTAPPVTPMTDHEATVSEMKSGPDSVRWIAPMAGVESIAEFKQMMDSIFSEDEGARFTIVGYLIANQRNRCCGTRNVRDEYSTDERKYV